MLKEPIPFYGFDDSRAGRVYLHGLLPHWRQPRCTYFVTFRLDDSIPQSVLEELDYERKCWLAARGIQSKDPDSLTRFSKLPVNERRAFERTLGRLLNRALDECHGSCVLRNPVAAKQVATALDYFHGTRVYTGDYVIMPNHVHALLTPINDFELEGILFSIKSYTANQVNRTIGGQGSLWQRQSYDHIVRDFDQLLAYQTYIAGNPSRSKLSIGEYICSVAEYVAAH